MDENLKKTLKNGAIELGADLGEGSLLLFQRYLEELKAWNKKINLTSVDSDKDIIIRHFLDSLTPLRLIKDGRRLLDIGSGAGFPGIPLKIARPSLEVVLMDSVEKKVYFMRHIIRTLGLSGQGGGITAIAARAEDPAVIERYRAGFDCVISRAFSELSMFLSMAMPYLSTGGSIIAIKGPAASKELKDVYIKGLSIPEVHEVRVPFTERVNTIIVFKKQE